MSSPASILDAQTQRLMQLVDDYREQRCRALLERAGQQSRDLLGQARQDALQRVREAIAAERVRVRERLETAEARQQTRHRQREQRQTLAALEQAWPLLQAALQTRWDNPRTRGLWVEESIRQALRTLPPQPWTLNHPPGWDTTELGSLFGQIREHCSEEPQTAVDESLSAGLRICCTGACVDASSTGLLVDRARINARLLARLHAGSAAK